jgi:hypothetical protein
MIVTFEDNLLFDDIANLISAGELGVAMASVNVNCDCDGFTNSTDHADANPETGFERYHQTH